MNPKTILLVCIALIQFEVNAQDSLPRVLQYFYAGNKAMELDSFFLADSLYTLSLDVGLYPDTYFNRALARRKLGDEKGYCQDMLLASERGDTAALRIHLANCGTNTELHLDQFKQPTFDSVYAYTLKVQGSKYMQNYEFKLYNHDGILVDRYFINDRHDTTRLPTKPVIFIENMPQFPGGESALQVYLFRMLHYPVKARDNGIEGTVVIQFIIDIDGSIHDIKVLRGIGGGCEEEAVRVVQSMPRWQPGTNQGIPTPVFFNLPMTFQLSSSQDRGRH